MAETLDLITSAEVNVVPSDWHRPAVTTVPMATVQTDVALLSDSDDATFVEFGGTTPSPLLATLIGNLDPVTLPTGSFTVSVYVRYSVEGPDVDDVAVTVTPTGPTLSVPLPAVGVVADASVDYSDPSDYPPGDYDLLLDALEAGTATLRVGAHADGPDALIRLYEAWLILTTTGGARGLLVRVFPIHE